MSKLKANVKFKGFSSFYAINIVIAGPDNALWV